MGVSARKVPKFQLPDWLVRVVAPADSATRQILPELGKVKNSTNAKAKCMLDWIPRSNEACIIAT
jgi:hypothetical protein